MSLFKTSLHFKIFDPTFIHSPGICSYLNEAGFTATVSKADFYNAEENLQNKTDESCWIICHIPYMYPQEALCKMFQQLRTLFPGNKVIIYSEDFSNETLQLAFQFDVFGFFLLSEDPKVILTVIETILAGGVALSEKVMKLYLLKKKIECFKNSYETASPMRNSSVRGQQVLSMMERDFAASGINTQLKIKKIKRPHHVLIKRNSLMHKINLFFISIL